MQSSRLCGSVIFSVNSCPGSCSDEVGRFHFYAPQGADLSLFHSDYMYSALHTYLGKEQY